PRCLPAVVLGLPPTLLAAGREGREQLPRLKLPHLPRSFCRSVSTGLFGFVAEWEFLKPRRERIVEDSGPGSFHVWWAPRFLRRVFGAGIHLLRSSLKGVSIVKARIAGATSAETRSSGSRRELAQLFLNT
ncbi:hypothetical protein L345_02019, partial [Ophiophagus hannah]